MGPNRDRRWVANRPTLSDGKESNQENLPCQTDPSKEPGGGQCGVGGGEGGHEDPV